MNQVGVGLSGASGTGSFAGTTSASLTTPSIDVINDTNGNSAISFSATPSATNYFNFLNAGVLSGVAMQAVGAGTNIGMTLNTKGTGQFVLSTEALTQPFAIVSGTSSQKLTNFAFANTAGSNVVTFPDASGTVLFANRGISSVVTQVFTTPGSTTYTPTSGMVYAIVELVGGGGGGGSTTNPTVGTASAAGGGGSGGYARKIVTAADIGASKSITIGGGGAGGTGANNGTAGGNSVLSISSAVTANGGSGGAGSNASTNESSSQTITAANGGVGGAASGGDVNITGGGGSSGLGFNVGGRGLSVGGSGGISYFGGAGEEICSVNSVTARDGAAYGSGGGGSAATFAGSGQPGGGGRAGIIIITEFVAS